MEIEDQPRMRIAIASSGLGHVTRGIEAWASDLAEALAHRGQQVILCKGAGVANRPYERVISCWQRGARRTTQLLRRLPPRIGWRLGLGTDYGVEQTTFALGLLDVLRDQRIDILHVQDPHVARLVQAAHRLRLVSTKTILGHATNEPASFLRKITYLQHLAPWHETAARSSGAWKSTWTVIPNFIDTNHFVSRDDRARDAMRRELGVPHSARMLLSVAALKRQHKRVDYLIREVAQLRRRRSKLEVCLVVAGGTEAETAELLGMGRDLLGERFLPLIQFPRQRMSELYAAADVFVLASLREMMPIALLEAAASGLPCLVHQHPSLKWLVAGDGAAIDMETQGALAGRLDDLLADPVQARAMGEAARARCVRCFGQESVVDQILRYYEFVLEHASRRHWRARLASAA
jgi:glycosyltransferase involved in cell wall biosynthesis